MACYCSITYSILTEKDASCSCYNKKAMCQYHGQPFFFLRVNTTITLQSISFYISRNMLHAALNSWSNMYMSVTTLHFHKTAIVEQ